ncbi:hypothetical protein [Peptoniphilus sp. HCN-40583]|uniref:hypothetical protein n=1 Tax=Peptoniphilus sp. HCN-40583 TaxID=3134662 RepID=UPI0030BBEF2C
MNKKFLSLVLALVMVLGTFSSVFAAKPAEKKEAKEAPKATEKVVPKITGKTEKIKWLQNEGVIEGRKVNEDPKNNDLALDKNIQRAEVSKLLVFATGNVEKVDKLKGLTIYRDVALNHWANGYINVGSTEGSKANGIAFLLGYPGNVFKPANDVTYAELAKMLVTICKTDLTRDMHNKANANWPAQWMAWAAELGIFDDVTVADANKAVNRADAFTMIYNTLYKLGNLKQFPVNETMGVISQIKNGEITLNQGEKAKTVKLTANTTFVLYDRSYDVNVKKANETPVMRTVLASALSNPSFYYGSLVRVIVNEKGEATHVLELGNPKDLALENRWEGIADKTYETSNTVLAKVNYEAGDAKSISFDRVSVTRTLVDPTARLFTARLSGATRYFVADVNKNQLTEVKDVDEALRIVGNTMAAGYIDRVYVGYDEVGNANDSATHKATNIKGYNVAKVVVFNKVQKDNNATKMLRVKMDANTNYNITFEDVDAKEVIENVASIRTSFPNNYKAKKLDVVNYSKNAADGIVIERVIEHADKKMFPIVKVTKVDDSYITVQDAYNRTAQLKVDLEANVFTNGPVKVGDLIQFRTLTGNKIVGNDATPINTVDVISIMPAGVKAEGTLQTVVSDNQAEQRVGKVIKVEEVGGVFYATIVKPEEGIYGDATPTSKVVAVVSKEDKDLLKEWIKSGMDVLFKVQPYGDKEQRAFDFMGMFNREWLNLSDALAKNKDAQQKALDAFNTKLAKVPDAKADYTGDKELKDLAAGQAAQKAVADLKAEFEGLNVSLLSPTDVATAKTNLNKAITAFNEASADANTGNKYKEVLKVEEVK